MAYLYAKKKNDLKWYKYTDQITRLRMTNIRNRVSPHFIFNILNREICIFDPTDPRREELLSLTKLLRRSLEITEQLSVTLTQELEFVRTYITLEEKSLGQDFTLLWEMDDQIDYNQVFIPAMMIQIPVENAIKHALCLKEGEKVLHISVNKEAENICIRILDNGMEHLSEISLVTTNGTGTGFKVLYQTIELLNSKNTKKISLTTNLNDKERSGTLVSIHIPDHYSYIL